MATTVGGIKVKIGADLDNFQSGLKKTRKGLNQVGKWGAAAAAAAVVGGAAIVKSQMKVLDSLAKTSDALGIQQEKLQALHHIGELTGTSSDQLNISLQKMQKNLGNAARMGGASADALEDLGVSVQDIVNKSPDQQIEILSAAIGGIENQALKASIANDIFGRSGTRMLKMLEQLKNDGLAPTEQALSDMGVTLSRVDTSMVENANDALFKAGEVATGVANKFTVKLAPIIEAVANEFIGAATESKGFGDSIDSAFNGALSVIGVFADGVHGIKVVAKGLEVAFRAAGLAIIKVWQGVVTFIDTVINNAMSNINSMIDALNNMPGIDIDKLLITDGEAKQFIDGIANAASEGLDGAIDELHNKMMEPLPSDSIKEWVSEAQEAAKKVSEELTKGVAGSGESGGAVVPKEQLAAAQTEMENLLTLNQSKLEAIAAFEDEKMMLINSYKEQGLITDAEHDAAKTEIETNGINARQALEEAAHNAKIGMARGAFSDLSALMNTNSKKAFKVGKTAALAAAGIDGIQSAISAWKSGMSTGGPYAPLVAAAYTTASLAKTGSMIQQISSQSFGSPSSPTSFSGGTPVVNTANQSPQQQTNVSIDIVGSEGSTFSRDQIVGLIGGINDALDDGVTLNTGG